jgi:hypothetical protein
MPTGKGGGADHADGMLTSRRTFQKYFGQAELRAYVAQVLDREPVSGSRSTIISPSGHCAAL